MGVTALSHCTEGLGNHHLQSEKTPVLTGAIRVSENEREKQRLEKTLMKTHGKEQSPVTASKASSSRGAVRISF